MILSIGASLATASAVNPLVFTRMQMSLAMAEQLSAVLGRPALGQGTQGVLFRIAAILIGIKLCDLNALASIASATFLISYLSVHKPHWRLAKETSGLRSLAGSGFLSMAVVLALFLWSMVQAEPWPFALIAILIAGSSIIEFVLIRPAPLLSRVTRGTSQGG